MGYTEAEFAMVARRDGLALVDGYRVPWLTNRGHENQLVIARVPEDTVQRLKQLFVALGGQEVELRRKRAGNDPCPDFFLDAQLFEVDEVQHFTTDRLRTFEFYPQSLPLGFSIEHYRQLIVQWSKTGDGYRAAKMTRDFPFVGGRRAQRAYFDAVRDLVAPTFTSRPVLRVPAPECDPHLAWQRVRHQVSRC